MSIYPVPSLPRPSLRTPIVDPTFGTTIMRVTDPSMAPSIPGNPTLGLRHEYSRFPALNSDNTLMVVRVIGGAQRGAFQVRNVHAGGLLATITPQRGDPECFWHLTDSEEVIYRAGNQIRRLKVTTGAHETLAEFPQYFSISTRSEGRPSDDRRWFAYIGIKGSSTGSWELFVYDRVNKKIVSTMPLSSKPDWVSMSPSGRYVVVQWTDARGTEVYDRALKFQRVAFHDHSHADLMVLADGSDGICYQPASGAAIIELGSPRGCPLSVARLSDGKRWTILPMEWGISVHISGIGSRARKGWVLVSTYFADSTKPQLAYGREIFWANTNNPGEVKHVCHHHSTQSKIGTSKEYWSEVHAVPSWDGSRVVFCSNWGETGTHYDCFVATNWKW